MKFFYLDQSMHEAHDALLCIKNKTYISDKDRDLNYQIIIIIKMIERCFFIFRFT